MTRGNVPVIPLFFVYCGLLSFFFPQTHYRPVWTALLVIAIYYAVRKTDYVWHWVYLALVLLAFQQMDWFKPAVKDHVLENVWIRWDRTLLHDWGFQRLIEAAGPLVPYALELSYLLVYAVGPFSVALLYICKRPERVQTLLVYYQTATLLTYAFFPYFPSDPPRLLFPGADLPNLANALRSSNNSLLNNYSIHSSVFPSAHVSSAFGAAFGLMAAIPEKKWAGRGMLIYAILVALSTIYGRYHYAIDAVAGLAIAVAVAIALRISHRPGASQTPLQAQAPAVSVR